MPVQDVSDNIDEVLFGFHVQHCISGNGITVSCGYIFIARDTGAKQLGNTHLTKSSGSIQGNIILAAFTLVIASCSSRKASW